MAKTFKQQVEEIESCRASLPLICKPKSFSHEVCNKYEGCAECHTDRILAAHNAELDRIAEELKQQSIESAIDVPCWNGAQQAQLKTDQAYIQAQKGS